LGTPQLDNDTPPASGAPQLENDSPPASGAPHLYNDPPPASGTSQLDNNRPTALGTPQLDNDPQPASEASHLHNDPLTAPETSSVHGDLPSGSDTFDESYRFKDVHYELSPYESEAPSLRESEMPSLPHASPFHEWEPSSTNRFISDAMKDKIRFFATVGAIGVSFTGLMYGLHKLNHHSQPTGRDLTSSGVVGRGVSTHPRPPRRLVSRALANLRIEDLRLLSVLTRRALERLD